MAQALRKLDVQVTVATTDDDGPGERVGADIPPGHPDQLDCYYFRKDTEFYKYSWQLGRWLQRNVMEFDVVHVHALFSHSSIAAARAAYRAGVPYVVRPLGVLNKWGMENRRPLLKKISMRWLERPILKRAAALHFTSGREQEEASESVPEIRNQKSVVIPLPVELQKLPVASAEQFFRDHPEAAGREIVLFLSRIDPKKGLELLISAFAKIRKSREKTVLVLAGEGPADYEQSLRRQVEGLGLTAAVIWTGFLDGQNKQEAMAAASLFVLCSYSENFGIAAAEALAAGVPVLLSDQVAVADDVCAAKAGIVVECNVNAIASGLHELLADPALRSTFAARGRLLAEELYSSAAIGQKLKRLYQSVMQLDHS